MTMRSWIQKAMKPISRPPRRNSGGLREAHSKRRAKLCLEVLEDRLAPAIVIVQNNSDGPSPGPVGSLRFAISNSQPNDFIIFNPSLAHQTIALTNGELDINSNLFIIGLGADLLTVSGMDKSRVFNISAGTVAITGLAITHGFTTTVPGGAYTGGGAIFNSGTLTLIDDAITDNTSKGSDGGAGKTGNYPGTTGVGGGIFNRATLTIVRCTVARNQALGGNGGNGVGGGGGGGGSAQGGGIFNFDNRSLTIQNSTISGNSAIGGNGGDGTAIISPGDARYGGNGGGYGGKGGVSMSGETSGQMGVNAQSPSSTGGGPPGGGGGGTNGLDTGIGGNGAYGSYGGGGGGGGASGLHNTQVGQGGHNFSIGSALGGKGGSGSVGGLAGGGGGGAGLGGGIWAAGAVTITSSTIANNTVTGGNFGMGFLGTSGGPTPGAAMGGGIFQPSNSVSNITLDSTIIATNLLFGLGTNMDRDVKGKFTDIGYNLIGSASGGSGFTAPTDVTPGTDSMPVDPHLNALANNGGPTQTMALSLGSLALNNGDPNNNVTIDQRGAVRGALSGPGSMANAGMAPDIGAWEASSLNIVTANFLGPSNAVGDSSNIGTFREAIEWANFSTNPLAPSGTPNTVLFDTTGVFKTPQTITLSLGTLTLSNTSVGETIGDPTLNSPSLLTVSGNNVFTVYQVNANVTATISGMTITGANTLNSAGGIDNGGTLTLMNVAISNNYGFLGGGIFNETGANLTITNSTISGNSALIGAAIVNNGTGTTTVKNSTITGNTALASGGGTVYVLGGTVKLYSSTLAKNMGGGGLINHGGTLITKNTIISDNVDGDISGNIGSQGHNLIRNPAGGSGFAGSDLLNVDPRLLSLANNGGPTQTMGLGFGSPAIDHGDNSGAPATDQRGPGFARIINSIIDIGAFETQIVVTTPAGSQSSTEATGQTFSLGSFTDAPILTSNYTVTILWGDGNQTLLTLGGPGMIPNQNHTYMDEGTYTITVQVNGNSRSDTGQNSITVSVTDPSLIATGGFSLSAAEGILSATQTVATFTDLIGAEANDGTHYSASINWGDGTTATTGTISGAGPFTVQGSHAYAEEGKYTITVTINHETSTAQLALSMATVADLNVQATGNFPFAASAGVGSATQTVATFTDPAGVEMAGDYTASINWGDGNSTAGTILLTGMTFTVSGSHTYASNGSNTITVTINHDLASPAMVTDTATVSNSTISAMAVNISPTAGAPFTGAVATFTDPSGPGPIGNYSASIAWGDNTGTLTGTITLSAGVFTVTGSHTYAAAASDTMTITIYRQGMPTIVQGSAMVASLGQFVPAGIVKPISFWAGLQGQELVRRFGLTSAGQTLGQWLATTFPNLYGGNNGAPNLSPFTNAQISSYYLSLFLVSKGTGLDAEVLATSLEVFTTTLSLGGTTGQAYGFTVNSNGLGAYSWNIAASGQAFGVPNNTVLDVYQILLAANNTASGGEPWGSNLFLRNEAYSVFHGINGG